MNWRQRYAMPKWPEGSDDLGVVRPWADFKDEATLRKYKMRRRFQVPWISRLNPENNFPSPDPHKEERALVEGLCPWCGNKFKDDEEVARLHNFGGTFISDEFPFHPGCMQKLADLGRMGNLATCPVARDYKEEEDPTGELRVIIGKHKQVRQQLFDLDIKRQHKCHEAAMPDVWHKLGLMDE